MRACAHYVHVVFAIVLCLRASALLVIMQIMQNVRARARDVYRVVCVYGFAIKLGLRGLLVTLLYLAKSALFNFLFGFFVLFAVFRYANAFYL